MIGNRLVFKAYRKLAPGVQPEIEIGRFLTEDGRLSPIPRRCSARSSGSAKDGKTDRPRRRLRLRAQPGRRLGLHDRVSAPHARRAAPDRRRRAGGGDRRPSTSPTASIWPRRACSDNGPPSCTGRLATPTEDPAFAPEPITKADLRAWQTGGAPPGRRGVQGAQASPAASSTAPIATRPGRCWRAATTATRASKRSRDRRGCGREDPDPRRLPSRPGAGGAERLLHPRLRGRAGAPAGRAARQVVAAQGRRGHAALVRLRRLDRGREPGRGRIRQRRRIVRPLADAWREATEQAFLARLSRDHRGLPELSRERSRGRAPARALPAREGAVRDLLRSRQSTGLDRRSRSRG